MSRHSLGLGLTAAVLALPMLVFTATPSMFFGYESSDTSEVIQMTEQAKMTGGTYLELEELERAQIDSFITRITGEYEQAGTAINRIELTGAALREEELLWFIAIHSVANRQDLNAMHMESIRTLCAARLRCTPALQVSEDGASATLHITVTRLGPDALMELLGFDQEAKTWAGALYELLSESDALTQYAAWVEAHRPSHGGDGSYQGGLQHGTGYGNEIDFSGFVSPSTKNNLDLAEYAIQAWENNWGYVWGTFGDVLTQSLFEYKCRQYPDGVGNYAAFIQEHWLNRRTTDCVGLIKGYGWLDTSTGAIRYGTNGMPDYSANQMAQAIQNAGTYGADYGPISTMPEIVGLAVWKEGHIGVYIGSGYVIEAMNTSKGVVKTQVAGRGWSSWGKIPYINYLE